MLVLESLIVGFFTSLLVFYLNFRWKRKRLYELASKLDGPKGLPLIGSGHKFIGVDFDKVFKLAINICAGYRAPAKMWLGPELVVFVDDPECLQVVLNSQKCLDKSPFYDVLILTQGLVISGGKMWKHHRQILNPAFSIGVLQSLVPLFDEKSRIFVKNLKNEVDKKEFDVYHYTSACSLETLLKGTMDLDRDIQSDPSSDSFLHDCEM
jgi:cytochrome P450 family 4